MLSNNTSVSQRNIAALRSLTSMAPRRLERAQESHPDHRVYSSEGQPFPCPANGIMKAFSDIDFRNTKPQDLPEGMIAIKKRNYPKVRASRALGKSKWDFPYMKSGASMAVRISYPKDHELYWTEYTRIRNIGIRMWKYQRSKGYIDAGFMIQTSEEDISVGKLSNGDDVLAPHVVFWRIDGTQLDPDFQGVQAN